MDRFSLFIGVDKVMRLDNFIKEGIVASKNTKESLDMFEDAIQCIKKFNLWNDDIVWRGFGSKAIYGYILKISNDRSGFRSSWNEVVLEIMKQLGITSPIFTTKTFNNARFFGTPRVFIPKDNFKTYVNPNVPDLRDISDRVTIHSTKGIEERYPRNPIEVAKEFIQIQNGFPNTLKTDWQEMIITTSEYYLISPQSLIDFSKKGRYSKIKNISEIDKYNDVVVLYNQWKAYNKWFINARLKDNPNLLKYYSENYPKEWLNEI